MAFSLLALPVVEQEKYKSMMDKVEKYSSLYGLPRRLEDSIKLFYTFQSRKKIGSEEDVRATYFRVGEGSEAMVYALMAADRWLIVVGVVCPTTYCTGHEGHPQAFEDEDHGE